MPAKNSVERLFHFALFITLPPTLMPYHSTPTFYFTSMQHDGRGVLYVTVSGVYSYSMRGGIFFVPFELNHESERI